jgi:hypothetical protein
MDLMAEGEGGELGTGSPSESSGTIRGSDHMILAPGGGEEAGYTPSI